MTAVASVAASHHDSARPHSGEGRRCRVLQVFDTLGMGGAETWLLEVLRWFHRSAESLPVTLETEICLTSGESGRFDDEARALGARLHYIRYEGRRLPRFARAFRRVLAAGDFDAIHDHQGFAAGVHLGCALGRLPERRVVHFHNPIEGLEPSLPRRALWAASRLAIRELATYVAGTSQHVLDQHGFSQAARGDGVPRGPLYCGFDPKRFAGNRAQTHADVREEFGWPNESRIVLFVGRLESHFNQKNPEFALAVTRECLRADRSVRALFVGGGDEARRRFEARVTEWGLADRVRFTGTRSDVPRLMLGSDLLLFPSIAEGLGMVAVEAQAAGTPVLASDSTPTESRVLSELVSFLSLTASASEWAAHAQRMMDTRTLPHETALRAVERSPFSIASSASSLLALYLPAQPTNALSPGRVGAP